jgi:thiamine-monophosphate kinase
MENIDKQGTPISKFGKFGLINHLVKNARKENKTTVFGAGDDSAVINSGKNLTLVTTDLFLEGIHFNLIYTPLKHLGYKAVIRGISDIYAMNGTPGQILVGLGISSRFSVEQVEEIFDGIRLACDRYEVDLAGGDTTSSITGLTISVTAVGSVSEKDIIYRNGAKANDLICVTGDFGAAYMGLQLLERERKLFQKEKDMQPDLAGNEYIIGKQLKPEFPVEAMKEIKSSGIRPTSMTDVTDGLASDLIHICKLSGTGCRIFSERIPIDHETATLSQEFNLDPVTPALNGGEDYELLFTVPTGSLETISKIKDVKVVGHMTADENSYLLVGSGGSEITISSQGWAHSG